MQTKLIVGVVIGLLVGAGGGYYFGGQSAAAGAAAQARGGSGTFVRGQGGRGGAGAVFGTIIAKDATSITVQLGGPNATSTNGASTGTKIVLYDASTQVEKTATGSASDLTVGQMVIVQGSANSDGSVTAQTIQLRPAGSTPRGQ